MLIPNDAPLCAVITQQGSKTGVQSQGFGQPRASLIGQPHPFALFKGLNEVLISQFGFPNAFGSDFFFVIVRRFDGDLKPLPRAEGSRVPIVRVVVPPDLTAG